MRRLRLVCLLALVLLFSNQAVSQAALIQISPSQPGGISPNKDFVNKVSALQKVVYPNLLSRISPDGKSEMIFTSDPSKGPRVEFLNIQSGATITAQVAGEFPPLPLTAPAWLNNNTLGYIADLGDAPGWVSFNSDTGAGKVQVIGLPGYPVTLAPNGSQVVLVAPARGPAATSADENISELDYVPMDKPLVSPFTEEVKQSFASSKQIHFGDEGDVKTLRFATPSLVLLSLNLRNGQVKSLYSLPEGTAITGVGWTPDGSRLAVGRKALPEISRNGNYLSDQATQDGLGLLPPDKNPFFQNDTVDLVDFGSGSIKPGALKATDGNGDLFMPNGLSWSTDGKTLLVQMGVPGRIAGRQYPTYIFNQSTYHRYYTADGQLINSFESEETNAPNVSVPRFAAPDEVFIRAARRTDVTIFYHNKATGEFRRLPIPAGSVNDFVANERTRQIVFSLSSFQHVPELFRINWDGTGLTQLTNNNKDLAGISQVRVDPVDFTLSSGQKRSGYIIQGANASFPPSNVPLIMWQEGGPSGPYSNYFGTNVESPFNLLPQFGMAILFVPLPGQDGYGPAFYNALADNRNFGQIDIDEGAEIMQQAIARGYTSTGKNGITGCSYGGYFVSQTVTRYPDLYAAANTQCTLQDLHVEWTFGYTPYLSYLMGRTPSNDPEEYVKDSPNLNAYRIKTPLLIFDGTEDFLPYRISVNLHDQVAANGTPTNMLLFEKEGHGLVGSHSQLIAGQAQISWFSQYLGLS